LSAYLESLIEKRVESVLLDFSFALSALGLVRQKINFDVAAKIYTN
jgi:hypothetical protein